MRQLNNKQKELVIDHLYPAPKCKDIRSALTMVINEGTSIYAAEAEYSINKNTLNPKVKRIREMIDFIQKLNEAE
jgi:transposase-like protein